MNIYFVHFQSSVQNFLDYSSAKNYFNLLKQEGYHNIKLYKDHELLFEHV